MTQGTIDRVVETERPLDGSPMSNAELEASFGGKLKDPREQERDPRRPENVLPGPTLTGKAEELYQELIKTDYVQNALEKNNSYGAILKLAVSQAATKYQSNLDSLGAKVNTALRHEAYLADAHFWAFEPVSGLGHKTANTLARVVVDMPNMVSYARKAGTVGAYLEIGALVALKAISYIPAPFLTALDRGSTYFVRKRAKREAMDTFLEAIGETEKSLKEKYTDVKDRSKNIFRPTYQRESTPAAVGEPVLTG